MLKNRVIPCLLLKNTGLVKTLKFKDPKYVGDPINAIRIFNDKEVDELMVLDISASKERKEPNYSLIEQFASECFMPLCYGGGINTLEQAKTIFSLGVEKVCLQTAVINDFSIVSKLAEMYGNQSILVSIDVKKNILGQYKIYSSSTGKVIETDWKKYLIKAINSGAGEIVINAVDKDGTMAGMDLKLIEEACNIASVPIIAVGGAGSLLDIKKAVNAGASAVSAGAFFVFHGPHRAVLITYPNYSELEELFK
jgi:cyclase